MEKELILIYTYFFCFRNTLSHHKSQRCSMEFSSQYHRCQFPLWFLLWRNAGNQSFPRFPVAFQDSEWPKVKTLLDVTLCSIQSQGSRGGVELIVLAFLLCGLGSIPGLDTMCGVELVDCAISLLSL